MLIRHTLPLAQLVKHAQYFAQTCVIERGDACAPRRGVGASVEQLKAGAVLDEDRAFDDRSSAAPLLRMPFDAAWLRAVRIDPFDAARSRKASPGRLQAERKRANQPASATTATSMDADELVLALLAQAAQIAEVPADRAADGVVAAEYMDSVARFTLNRAARLVVPQERGNAHTSSFPVHESFPAHDSFPVHDNSDDPTLENPAIALAPAGSRISAPDSRQRLPQLSASTAHELAGESQVVGPQVGGQTDGDLLHHVPDSCASLTLVVAVPTAERETLTPVANVDQPVRVRGARPWLNSTRISRIASAVILASVACGVAVRGMDARSASAGSVHASATSVRASLQLVAAAQSHLTCKRPIDPSSLPLTHAARF